MIIQVINKKTVGEEIHFHLRLPKVKLEGKVLELEDVVLKPGKITPYYVTYGPGCSLPIALPEPIRKSIEVFLIAEVRDEIEARKQAALPELMEAYAE